MLGIIGLIPCTFGIPAVLALIFGIIGYNQVTKSGGEGGGKGMAIAGIVLGVIGGIIVLARVRCSGLTSQNARE